MMIIIKYDNPILTISLDDVQIDTPTERITIVKQYENQYENQTFKQYVVQVTEQPIDE